MKKIIALATVFLYLAHGACVFAEGYIYWAESDPESMIRRADLDGSNITDLVSSGLQSARGIYMTDTFIYWTDTGSDKIQRAYPDGSDVTDLVTGLQIPLGLFVTDSFIYWTDNGTNKVQRANLDGSIILDLVTGLNTPWGVYVTEDFVYWADRDAGKIQRASLDGSGVTDILTGLPGPVGISVTDSSIYWADQGTDKIYRANLDGSGIDDLVSGLDIPFGIVVMDDFIYYTDISANKIGKASLDGSVTTDLITGLSHPAGIAVIPEPTAPPVADANGPYTIYVGDTLTLDANSSTDADDDIVSYMWDLDDNGSFETDAGSQAIFDVNYAYLESLALIVDHTYNIHVQVTDSEGQSDVADSTLTIVPKRATVVAVDIKPGSCPNPVNVKSKGVLPIAILGTSDYDVTTIDPTSIRLIGVEPIRSGYEDVAGPVSDGNDCECITDTDGPDGFLDLTLKFMTQRIVEAVGDVNDSDLRVLTLTGVLFAPMLFETPIEGADCILIRGRHKPINRADINKDGVVNATDFAIIAENWLQSSIVQD
jgi:hypothetical protein